jgi:cellulose synthase/poly-beta-1,6-N-acetylglucosamine synthase-like glycosyltransferase
MPTPRTSFVLPCHNGGATLREAIDSICAQSDGDLELLVIADRCTDDSHTIAADHPDQRVRLITSPGIGIVAALNHGLKQARGTYIARMDADDIARPHRLERQLAALADPALGVIDGQVRFISDTGPVPTGMHLYAEWVNSIVSPADFDRELLVESPIVHPAATFRRELALQLGGYREGPFPEDYDLWLRVHAQGYQLRKVPEVLVEMRDHSERLTRTDTRYNRDGFRRVRQQWLESTHLQGPRTVVLWGAGKECRPWLRWLLAAGHRVAAIVDVAPRRIGGSRKGVPIIAMDELDAYPAELGLVLVGARGKRALIREAIRERLPRWQEGVHWWAVR